MKFQPDKYYRFSEIQKLLAAFSKRFPTYFAYESIGKSGEGRDIWVATITAPNRSPESKPAYWIDANTHASEVAGSSAALYTMQHLLENRESDEVKDLLSKFTFYICPRLNPDGAEYCLDKNKMLRSVPRNYPDASVAPDFISRDLSGDGRVLQMRWENKDGAWCKSNEDARLMVPRMPWSTGPFFHFTVEGVFTDEGARDPQRPMEGVRPYQLDFNRNYPHAWRPQHSQAGAGNYPLSEPETRAVVDFLLAHKNVGGMVTHHTYSGVILRPFTDKDDKEMPPFDLAVYKIIGDRGEELTGYPCMSVFHDFIYNPKKPEGGVFDDWAYEHYGVHCYTMELWDPQKRAGIDLSKGYLDFWLKCTDAQELKMLKWSDTDLEGKGFIDWISYSHAQLGDVEIGGWDWMYSTRNPPPKYLEETSEKGCAFALAHAACLPVPSIEIKTISVDIETTKVDVVLQNHGFLPTYISDLAKQRNVVKPTTLEVSHTQGIEIIQGKVKQRVDHLAGIFNQNTPRYPAMFIQGETDKSKKVFEFIVKGKGEFSVEWSGDRIGKVVTKHTI